MFSTDGRMLSDTLDFSLFGPIYIYFKMH